MSLTFSATGHPEILSTHRSTIEITKDPHLSANGDCIVAVNSSIGPVDLPNELRNALSRPRAKVRFVLTVDPFEFTVEGEGDPRITLTHPTDLVIRKSGFVSDRTLMIHADKAARDLPREMVELLRDPTRKVIIDISAKRLV